MATTWSLHSVTYRNNIYSISLQEVIDAVPGKVYSLKLHETLTMTQAAQKFKGLINTDRVIRTKEDQFKATVDLSNFENFLNQ